MMMLFFVLLSLAIALPAATVPQDSAGKYFFSTPYSTNLVGTVIGDPPAYRALRREDIAWIREAACERCALADGAWWGYEQIREEPEFGRWPLSESNRFERFATAREWRGGILETNIVVGWIHVTNAFGASIHTAPSAEDFSKPDGSIDAFAGLSFGSGTSRYLGASPNAYQSAWPDWHSQLRTNIVSSVVTNWDSIWGGAAPTTVVEHVTMEMTNGTVSVHTNTWTYLIPNVVTTHATNIVAGTVFDLLFAEGEARWLDASPPKAMRPFPAYSYMRDSYNLLRRMDKLAEYVDNTNQFRVIGYKWTLDTDDDWEITGRFTNETSFVGLDVSGTVIGLSSFGFESGNGRLVFPSRFSWDVVHTGGVCRIASADLYAFVNAGAEWNVGHSTTNGQGYFVTHLGQAYMCGEPQGGRVCFEATVNGPDIAKAGAAALGLPTRESWTGWEDDRCNYAVSFMLVYHLAPWTSLPGWNE